MYIENIMGNSLNNNRQAESNELYANVDDNEFEYDHNIENQFVIIDKIIEEPSSDDTYKCEWKSITKWSEISNKDKKAGLKNRNYYFSSLSYEYPRSVGTCQVNCDDQ